MNLNVSDLGTPVVIIGLGIAIMQMLKYADTNNVFKRFYPLASFIIGMVISFLFNLSVTMSLMTSLAIAGTYDGWKYTIKGVFDGSSSAPTNTTTPTDTQPVDTTTPPTPPITS